MIPSLTAATSFFEAHYRRAEASVTTSDGQRWLQHKRRHTYAVLAAMERIVLGEPELAAAPADEKRAWQLAALFHDLGRADEITSQGKLEASRSRFDHADASRQALRAHPEYGLMPDVLLAVGHHSWADLSRLETDADYAALDAPNRARALRGARLVRDADKVANLEFLAFDGFRALLDAPEVPARGPLSAAVAGRMERGETVLLADRETLSDCVAFMAAWWFDLNFGASKRALTAIGLPEAIGAALRAAGFSGDGVAAARKWFGAA